MPKLQKATPQLLKVTMGANQSATEWVIEVPAGATYVKPTAHVTEANASLADVREPRSFEDDRTSQVLRHLSTAAGVFLDYENVKGYQEVQASIDSNKRVIISTNTERGNNALRAAFAGRTLEDFSKMMGDPKYRIKSADSAKSRRQNRHLKKFSNKGRLQEVFGSNITKTLRVASKLKTKMNGYHAELRIRDDLEKENDVVAIQKIRGIKRPCAYCAKALGIKDRSHGPAWHSKAAKLSGKGSSKGKTSATLDDEGKPTVGYGTDSDTDAEGKLRAKPPRQKWQDRPPIVFSGPKGSSKLSGGSTGPSSDPDPY